LPWPISRRSEKSFSGSSLKNSSATSGSLRLPALPEDGILVYVVPYRPHRGDGTIWAQSYTKAAEDSSAAKCEPEEIVFSRLFYAKTMN
ncbi:hypothetical protein GOODEAATRI_009982, partial [Goodea atripinnis]